MPLIRVFAIAVVLFAGTWNDALNSLVEAERAFAGLSVSKGTREAFLANLNDESILFRPQAVPGKSWMEKNPPSASQLSWEPAFADLAKSGDLGYTTGPWELRRTPQDSPTAFGHYVTLWRKQSDGSWKIALDLGISHQQSPKPNRVESLNNTSAIENRRPENQVSKARSDLLAAEHGFPTTAQGHLSRLSSDARVYRNDSFPLVGAASIRQRFADTRSTFTWKVVGSDVAGSADFGYAYGTVEFKPTDSSKPTVTENYLRIWKLQKNGEWKVVLDLVS